MADSHNVLSFFAHFVHELHRTPSLIHCLRELASCAIQGSTKAISLQIESQTVIKQKTMHNGVHFFWCPTRSTSTRHRQRSRKNKPCVLRRATAPIFIALGLFTDQRYWVRRNSNLHPPLSMFHALTILYCMHSLIEHTSTVPSWLPTTWKEISRSGKKASSSLVCGQATQ